MTSKIAKYFSKGGPGGFSKDVSNIEVEDNDDYVTLKIKDLHLEQAAINLNMPKSFLSRAGKPAIYYAVRNNPKAILPLIRAGCDVMAKDPIHEDTPLHIACFHCTLDVIVLLVQQGACVNALNNCGQTPLDKLLLLCQHPSKDSTTRSRLLTAHFLTRAGFQVNPKAEGQCPGTRNRILIAYNKAKICFDCPSLLHICRLRVRELLPSSNLVPVVKLLSLPIDLQNFLLFRPIRLDDHVTCSHVKGLVQGHTSRLALSRGCTDFGETARQN